MKVGDYVRTRKGISKITFIEDEIVRKIIYTDTKEVFEYYTDNKGEEIKDYWENYSSNIIDLIQVGDYVNGMKIIDTSSQYYKLVANLINSNFREGLKNVYINNEKDIKSIVTKEQFESMEYRIGE